MLAVKLEEILFAFEFVGAAPQGENNAYICLDTGQIFWTSEFNPLEEKVPDDLETSDRYLPLPHKVDLDLGKRIALRFAASELPDCYDRIAEFFRHKKAYARFKDLLESEGALERWYKYEAQATERVLRDWCAENDIQPIGTASESTAQPVDAPDRLPAGPRPPPNSRRSLVLGVTTRTRYRALRSCKQFSGLFSASAPELSAASSSRSPLSSCRRSRSCHAPKVSLPCSGST